MLICVKCHRKNAPWAKVCAICLGDIQDQTPDTLTVPALSDSVTAAPEVQMVSVIAPLDTDTEWHGVDEIDETKLLDSSSNEPVTLGRFDSQPIPSRSRLMGNEEHFEFEKHRTPSSKRLLMTLSGLGLVAVLGGLAINYLHSTMSIGPLAPAASEGTAIARPKISATQPMPSNAVAGPAVIESVVPNYQLGALPGQPGSADLAKPAQSNPTPEVKPPVFVMSASEPITAKPSDEVTKIKRIPNATVSSNTPLSRPLPKVVEQVEKPGKSERNVKPVKPQIVSKNEIKPGQYPVLVPVPPSPVARPRLEQAQRAEANEAIQPLPPDTSAAPTPTSSRLQTQREVSCANSAFVGKLFCEERTRLDFCRNRWNEHPDCQLHNSRIEP
jgi:hypothetical protein